MDAQGDEWTVARWPAEGGPPFVVAVKDTANGVPFDGSAYIFLPVRNPHNNEIIDFAPHYIGHIASEGRGGFQKTGIFFDPAVREAGRKMAKSLIEQYQDAIRQGIFEEDRDTGEGGYVTALTQKHARDFGDDIKRLLKLEESAAEAAIQHYDAMIRGTNAYGETDPRLGSPTERADYYTGVRNSIHAAQGDAEEETKNETAVEPSPRRFVDRILKIPKKFFDKIAGKPHEAPQETPDEKTARVFRESVESYFAEKNDERNRLWLQQEKDEQERRDGIPSSDDPTRGVKVWAMRGMEKLFRKTERDEKAVIKERMEIEMGLNETLAEWIWEQSQIARQDEQKASEELQQTQQRASDMHAWLDEFEEGLHDGQRRVANAAELDSVYARHEARLAEALNDQAKPVQIARHNNVDAGPAVEGQGRAGPYGTAGDVFFPIESVAVAVTGNTERARDIARNVVLEAEESPLVPKEASVCRATEEAEAPRSSSTPAIPASFPPGHFLG